MLFSIIIPTKNSEKYLDETLQNIRNQDFPKNEFEVIIADDYSSDLTLKIAEKYKCKVITSKGPPGRQRNQGIKSAKGEIVVFIDSDAYPQKNWLSNAEEIFKKEQVDVLGGPTLTPKGDGLIADLFGLASSSRIATASMSARYNPKGKKIRIADEKDLISCNLFVKKEVFSRHFFNETMFPNEENELLYRIKNSGKHLIYSPGIIVYHHRRNSFKAIVKQIFNYGRGRVDMIKRQRGSFNVLFFLPLFGLVFFAVLPFINLYFFVFSLLIYFLSLVFVSFIYLFKTKYLISLMLPFAFFSIHLFYALGTLFNLFSPRL